MLSLESLRRAVDAINNRIENSPVDLSKDIVFLHELRKQGISDIELGEAEIIGDCQEDWLWWPFGLHGPRLIQYQSGRCALLGE